MIKKKNAPASTPGIEVREIALNILHQVLEEGAYVSIAIDRTLRQSSLSSQDRNLVTEITNGTIRMCKHLDWVLNLFLKKPIHKMNPWIRNILRMTLYQVAFMQRIPDHAAVDSAVTIARKKTGNSMAALVNGVMRNYLRNKEKVSYPEPAYSIEYLSVYYSQPEWIVETFLDSCGRLETQKILQYFNQAPNIHLRSNGLKIDRDQLLSILLDSGINAERGNNPWAIRLYDLHQGVESLPCYQEGYFYIQNEASMLAGAILDPQPEERILDLCSGVGGKATHFAELMEDYGTVYAVELYDHKLQLLRHNCERLGINSIIEQQGDILQLSLPAEVDRVFLDAPCSGLGVLNRRSDARWHKKQTDIEQLSLL
ncbi:MAG TPA: 16S rRNA (cytosine(967)-C(5))-methyltransferase RsmB [Syntrophomonadaceae bacterium]|nr:16S rRNA (cytosine(967)-C(5))-methyltransferase RsmB [Syntrophomonadaceae bacterium]